MQKGKTAQLGTIRELGRFHKSAPLTLHSGTTTKTASSPAAMIVEDQFPSKFVPPLGPYGITASTTATMGGGAPTISNISGPILHYSHSLNYRIHGNRQQPQQQWVDENDLIYSVLPNMHVHLQKGGRGGVIAEIIDINQGKSF